MFEFVRLAAADGRNPPVRILGSLYSRACVISFAAPKVVPPVVEITASSLSAESAADEYKEHAIGVILTGANRDGALGLAKIKARGGLALVEDPASAAFREMPEAAIDSTDVDQILTLEEIAPFLIKLVTSRAPLYAT